MGDYSSTFRFRNDLNIDLTLVNDNITTGYWLQKPNNGVVKAHSVSDYFQVKDKWGPEGTEGTMDLVGTLEGITGVVISIRVLCGVHDTNVATISSQTKELLLSVSNWDPKVNPLVVEFIIDKQT